MIFNDFRKRFWPMIMWQITILPTRHISNWKLRRFVNGLLVPLYILRNIGSFFSSRFILPVVTLTVTRRCILNCKECVSLYQYYRVAKGGDISFQDLAPVIDRLYNSVDGVHSVCMGGGEPFMNPEISSIIDEVANSPKVSWVRTYTTGMPIPSEKVLKSLANPKVTVGVSDYGEISKTIRNGTIQSTFEAAGVMYRIENNSWQDFGGFEFRNRTKRELARQFSGCWARMCLNVINGELHYCPRSAYGMDLGIIPRNPDDYVDLMSGTTEEVRAKIKKFLKKDHISVCNYCDGCGKTSTLRGVQVRSVTNKVISKLDPLAEMSIAGKSSMVEDEPQRSTNAST